MTDIIKFANNNPVCFLATLEGDQPRVRALGFWFADDSGFYFQTGAVKDLYRQLKDNPKTEVCFFRQGPRAGAVLRVSGSVEFLDDEQLKKKVMIERPFLKDFGLSADSPDLVIFRIPHGEAHFWSMETSLEPKDIIRF